MNRIEKIIAEFQKEVGCHTVFFNLTRMHFIIMWIGGYLWLGSLICIIIFDFRGYFPANSFIYSFPKLHFKFVLFAASTIVFVKFIKTEAFFCWGRIGTKRHKELVAIKRQQYFDERQRQLCVLIKEQNMSCVYFKKCIEKRLQNVNPAKKTLNQEIGFMTLTCSLLSLFGEILFGENYLRAVINPDYNAAVQVIALCIIAYFICVFIVSKLDSSYDLRAALNIKSGRTGAYGDRVIYYEILDLLEDIGDDANLEN